MRLILASASPRRAELLASAGYDFETMVVPVDESMRSGESPAEYVRRLAAEKSAAVWALLESRESAAEGPAGGPARGPAKAGHYVQNYVQNEAIVLAADTVVVAVNEILGKPVDDHEARRMLRLLSGRSHLVLTGVSLRGPAGESGLVEETRVWFSTLSNDEVDWYVQTGEGRDKAGAYAIQGRAARFIPRVEGSYSNVVGLPVAAVHGLIRPAVASAG